MWIATSQELADIVRERRRALSLTQRELAKRIGASRQWVMSLEAAKETTEFVLVLRTLAALGLRMDVAVPRPLDAESEKMRAQVEEVLASSRDPNAPVLRLHTSAPRRRAARRAAGQLAGPESG